jgi:methionyl-tRNA formyltransferase
MPKYKRLLIISDNFPLLLAFHKILVDKKADIEWTFASSPFSDFTSQAKEAGLEVSKLNLRDSNVVEKIIETYDLVVSIHCKQIFPERLVNAVKCINVHPGYNPVNRGWYPQVHAIIKDLPIGATIHEIDEKLDHGPIISRAFVEKRITDTSLSLYNRILEKELELLDANILDILDGNYSVSTPEDEGVLHLRKDFDNLREFDLESRMTGMEFINRLRGMTHGDFRNLFFRDPETGRKIFVSISLTEEAD